MGFDQIGKYEVLGLLGQGAMGEVKKARDPSLNRLVAIKTIAKNLVLDEHFKKRFEREARAAALLSHPNIVTVYELGEEEGIVYLVMELLGGTDLRELIARRVPLSLKDTLSIAEQICAGLAFAHDHGIIHRDLKPANVHVLPGGVVKILDFGLARLSASDLTRTGTVMGTPNYMSPEQVRGERADARSDLFAVGAVLYETLCGHKAFKSESAHATLYDVLERDPIPLRSLLPRLPPAVAEVAERALRKDPAQRFASAEEMRKALEAARLSSEGMTLDPGDTLMGREQEASLAPGRSVAQTAIVDGSTALDLRSQAPALRQAVPEPTLASSSEVTLPGRLWPGRWATVGLTVSMMTVFAVGYWWMLKTSASPSGTEPSFPEVERAWVQSQTAAAQMGLEIRDYGAAAAEAERILARYPQSREAREILEEGRRLQGELDTAAGAVRAAFTRGDQAGASAALKQVLALDVRHPVIGEIGPALDQYFRGQADNARRVATRARRVAQGAGASSSSDFGAAATLVAEGEALFVSGKFTQATQKFVEGSDGFARARRQGVAAGATAPSTSAPAPAAAVVAETPPPLTIPAAPATGSARPVPAPPTPSLLAPPSAAPALPMSAPPVPSALPPASGPSPEQAVRDVIADYGRALEARDLGLFKSVMPGLSRDQERQVRDSFRDVRSLRVSLTVHSVEVSGNRARARVSRVDVLEGKGMKPIDATFVLVERDGVWAIESIGPSGPPGQNE